MKSIYQAAVLLVALAVPPQVLAAHRPSNIGPAHGPPNGGWTPHGSNPSPITSTTTTTASSAAVAPVTATSPDTSSSTSPAESSCDGFAINFTGDLNYDYWVGGSFGNETGSLSDKSSFCFPNGDSGGRVNIGQVPNPSDGAMLSGNSLIECDPVTAGTPGCDVSYVDGFSVGLTCTMANGAPFLGAPGPIGCASNILAACPPAQQNPSYNLCTNPGFDSDAAVSAPWTDCLGTDTGGAIVWPNGDGYFYLDPDLFPVVCTVHGEGTVAKRAVRGSAASVEDRAVAGEHVAVGKRQGLHAHAGAHVKRSRRSAGLAKGSVDGIGGEKL